MEEELEELLGVTIGYTGVELDSRESTIRKSETNFGNMMSDLIRTENDADFGLINSGTFRNNTIMPVGPLSLKDINKSFPFNDIVMVIKMSGALLKEALEISVA